MLINIKEDLDKFLNDNSEITLYGTGGMGFNIYRYAKRLGHENKIKFFVVSKSGMKEYCNTKVKVVTELTDNEKRIPVIIATRNNFHHEIIEALLNNNINNYITVSEDLLNYMERLANQEKDMPNHQVDKNNIKSCENIYKFCKYFDELIKNKDNYLILISVKDTCGISFDEYLAQHIEELLKVNLYNKHWHGYVFGMYKGKILANEISAYNKSVKAKFKADHINVELLSAPFNAGNYAKILVNGIDYSVNGIGLNIVVIDVKKNIIRNSVNFNTHDQLLPCINSKMIAENNMDNTEKYMIDKEQQNKILGVSNNIREYITNIVKLKSEMNSLSVDKEDQIDILDNVAWYYKLPIGTRLTINDKDIGENKYEYESVSPIDFKNILISESSYTNKHTEWNEFLDVIKKCIYRDVLKSAIENPAKYVDLSIGENSRISGIPIHGINLSYAVKNIFEIQKNCRIEEIKSENIDKYIRETFDEACKCYSVVNRKLIPIIDG